MVEDVAPRTRLLGERATWDFAWESTRVFPRESARNFVACSHHHGESHSCDLVVAIISSSSKQHELQPIPSTASFVPASASSAGSWQRCGLQFQSTAASAVLHAATTSLVPSTTSATPVDPSALLGSHDATSLCRSEHQHHLRHERLGVRRILDQAVHVAQGTILFGVGGETV